MAAAFHNATSAQGNPLTSQSFALPTISAGDVILLWVSWTTAGAVTISGAGTWTHQGADSVIAAQLQVGLWTAVSAAGAESGQNVTINVAAQEKFAAVAMSYSGVDNTTPLQSGPTYAQNTTSNTTSATAPSVSPSPAGTVLEGYASKSSTNASYSTPAGTTSRQQIFGSGAGACDFAVFDTNADVSSGGNQTSTLGTATANKVAVTVVLTTASTPVSLSDAGTGSNSLTVAAAVTLTNPAAGVDSLTVASAVTLAQGATAADTLTVAHTLPDAGQGTDRLTVAVAVPLSDTGRAADGLTATAVTWSEHGTAGNTLTLSIAVVLTDVGTAAESMSRPSTFPHGRTDVSVIATGRTYAVVAKTGRTAAAAINGGQTTSTVGVSGRTTATSR